MNKAARIKIAGYQKRLDTLKDRLYEEQLAEHQKINNLGWGAAMRRSKISISFTKSERTQAQIEKLEKRIQDFLQAHAVGK